jgi:hypothetical protein
MPPTLRRPPRRVEAEDLRPGDKAILVLHATVLRRRETAHGPQFRVELPLWFGVGDFAPAEPALGRLREAAERAEGAVEAPAP